MAPRSHTLTTLAAEIDELAKARAKRILVALAGPPGVGKSLFAETLRKSLNTTRKHKTEIMPMDGFHYDDSVLEERGARSRKGAPHTFDVEGLEATLARVKTARGDVAVPVFDRTLEIARAGARIIGPDADVLLVEGNYLLLAHPRWAPLRNHFDLTVLLEAPLEEIERRLRLRWQSLEGDALSAKLEGNDLLNARLVLEESVEPDVRVANVAPL